jgi:Putative Actinobacterial Holin-X, holin superfamily III
MLAPSGNLLRAGLDVKLNQIKRATRSYLRDRTDQAKGAITSYAIATGLFAAAGIFLIAACVVSTTALFRWIEINYGLFWAFGTVGALLMMLAATCAAVAVLKLRRPAPQFPSLTRRLRVAITASPVRPDQVDAVKDTAATILMASAPPLSPADGPKGSRLENRNMQVGLIAVAALLGWAAVRRYQARRADV